MAADFESLVEAVKKNSLTSVKKILSGGKVKFDINEKDSNGCTILHIGLKNDKINSSIVKLLLRHNADVNLKNKNGNSPLYLAMQRVDNLLLVELLLKHGADLDSKNNLGWTPFDKCFETKSKMLKNLVLGLITDANFKSYRGRNVLHYAVEYRNSETLKRLIQMGMNVNEKNNSGNTPLHIISLNRAQNIQDTLEKIHLLVASGADVNAQNNENDTPLSLETQFARQVPSSVTQCLLKLGADPNIHGDRSPLYNVIFCKNVKLTKLLISHGADVYFKNGNGCSLLTTAMHYDYSSITDYDSKHAITRLLMIYGVTLVENDYTYNYPKDVDLLKTLQREFRNLKVTRIYERFPLTYYDLLINRNEILVRYLRRKDFRTVIETGNYKKKFINFSIDLEAKYLSGLELIRMLDDFVDLLDEVFEAVLPHDVVALISQYFGEDDLKKCFNKNSKSF